MRRLEEEGADDLTERLRKCGLAFKLTCKTCAAQHELSTRCNRKWCPCCARQIAAKRAAKLRTVAGSFKWPLFVTLTRTNITDRTPDTDFVRQMRKSFGKLRKRDIWTARVKGGAAAIEVTNTGKGWHPHLHALIDCEWLAIKTPRLSSRDSQERKEWKCQKAAEEITAIWTKCQPKGVPGGAHIKRASADAAAEVMKYAVKGSDLIESPDEIAPVLRLMDGTRLVTTFGSAFGIEVIEPEREPLTCPNGHSDWTTQHRVTITDTHHDDGREYPEGYWGWSARQRLHWQQHPAFEASIDAQIAAEAAEDDIPF